MIFVIVVFYVFLTTYFQLYYHDEDNSIRTDAGCRDAEHRL